MSQAWGETADLQELFTAHVDKLSRARARDRADSQAAGTPQAQPHSPTQE